VCAYSSLIANERSWGLPRLNLSTGGFDQWNHAVGVPLECLSLVYPKPSDRNQQRAHVRPLHMAAN
jgi:hypothetical protein